MHTVSVIIDQFRTLFAHLFRSSLLRSSGIYTMSRVVNSAIPFLLIPVLTRYLSPTDYGILAMFTVLLGITSPLIGLSIHGAISVKYFDKEETALPVYIGNCLLILVASTILVAFLFWLFAERIEHYTQFPRQWLWAVVVVSFAQFISLILMTLWQVQNKAFAFGLYQNAQTVLLFCLSILLVVVAGKNWQGRIEAHVMTMLLFMVAAFIILARNGWITFKVNVEHLGHALKFGIPLIPHAIGSMIIVQTDRLFITNMVGVADAGIYTLGYQISNVIELLASSFHQAYIPWLYERLTRNNEQVKREIVRYTYLYFLLILIFAVSLSAVGPFFLLYFAGEAFVGAGKFIVWLAMGFAFSGMYYMVSIYLFYVGKTYLLALTTFLSALLNIILNYVLIKRNGAIGAAQATACAFFTSFVLSWLMSARAFPMPWRLDSHIR